MQSNKLDNLKSNLYRVVSFPLTLVVSVFIIIEAMFVIIPSLNRLLLGAYVDTFIIDAFSREDLINFLAYYTVIIILNLFLGFGVFKLICKVSQMIDSFMKKHLKFIQKGM